MLLPPPLRQLRPRATSLASIRRHNISCQGGPGPWPPRGRAARCNRSDWWTTIHFLIALLFVALSATPSSSSGLPLDDFVRHFEPAFYAPLNVNARSKRDLNGHKNLPLTFNITAHNRLFRIKVHNNFAQANDVFAEDAVVESSDGPIDASGLRERIYAGVLEDLPDASAVHGIVTKDGLFDGHISTPLEDYYIEPASRYFSEDAEENGDRFHSVIYKASDVVHPHHEDMQSSTACKSHELYLRRKEEAAAAVAKAAAKVPTSSSSPRTSFSTVIGSFLAKKPRSRRKREAANMPLFENIDAWPQQQEQKPRSAKQIVTTYEIVDWDDVPESVKYHFRKRNEARLALAQGKGVIDKKRKTCMLYLQADHLFYEAMGSEEACIETMTRHVQRVNSIYKPIDFDQDGEEDNIQFMIKRIKVHTSKALEDPAYRFPGNYGVEKFLEIFSEENYDAFCLAYMFTYRDFEGGTLGLAWTGDMKNAGGVCERNGHYRGTLKSLNTGIITLLNYGKHVPPAVSHVTMAHEMGHNFGSPHYPENNKACVPGGEDGNYIMFARATSGDKINNRKFSPCSLKSIKPVLLSKAIGLKGCFQEPKQALCGNGVVEEGEQCDCGWEEDCEEDCCWPQRTEHPPDEKPCTLKPKRDCSPSQGPCCTNTCTFKIGEKCLDDNGCREESFCDGTAPTCPISQVKPNKTVCNKEFVCYKGECTGSICLAYGLESCQCSQGPEDSATKACELCCKEPGDGKPCLSSFELNQAPLDVPDMFSKPGTPCNNYAGYCDVFQKCREVDPSGPLATLRKLLLSEESIATLKRFLMRYWYTVIFIVLGVFILMAIIIKVCGKKTPLVRSRRKRRRPTIQHGADHNGIDNPQSEVQVHPTAVEASVPLGKKVRKGERRKKSKGRKVSKSHERSPPTSSTVTSPTGETGSVEDGVARAVRLAANLSNQLFVDLPLEATTSSHHPMRSSSSPSSPPEPQEVSNNATAVAANGNSADLRKSRGKQKKANKERKHKSLSPEKRLASTLAQSMSSISKSFEKLDLVGHRRRRRSKGHHRPGQDQQQPVSQHTKKHRRRSRPEPAAASSNNATKQKEVTIAKLGRFKFSVEVAKHFDEELKSKNKGQQQQQENNGKKKVAGLSKKDEQRKESSQVAKLPSIHVTNFNAQKSGLEQPSSLSNPASNDLVVDKEKTQQPFIAPSVIVSKKRKERPRRERNPERKRSAAAGLDYRKSFGGNEKFTRSISHPGPGPQMEDLSPADESSSYASLCNPDENSSSKNIVGKTRNYSFAHGQRPPEARRPPSSSRVAAAATAHHDSSRKLRRSETERVVQKPSADHLWVTEFDNQAYDKSPEPLHHHNLRQLPPLPSDNNRSVSLNSLNVQSFEVDDGTSTDSDLELLPSNGGSGTTSSSSNAAQISRAKILETVGVIVNNVTTTPTSTSSANLLLPHSSSSPSSSSSVSLAGATSLEAATTAAAANNANSSNVLDEPRLAFIGCETTSTLSSPLSVGGGSSAKRPSLSDRYPSSSKSDEADNDDEEDMTEDNLDIISIITDGMN